MNEILAAQYEPENLKAGVTFFVKVGEQLAMTDDGMPVIDEQDKPVMVPVTEQYHFGGPSGPKWAGNGGKTADGRKKPIVAETAWTADEWVEHCKVELELLLASK